MKLKRFFIGLCVLSAAGVLPLSAHPDGHTKVISLLPSTTEILYALEAQDKVIGVTRYCMFPPEARKEKTIVGGLLDVNYEVIYSLNPDLVILQDDENELVSRMKKMKIPTLQIETRSLDGIIKSIELIGEAVDKKEKAQQIVGEIKQMVEYVQKMTKDLTKPTILVTYLRPLGEGSIREVYIAGNFTFFDDLIEIAGGVNAYQGSEMITSPVISPEGILRLNPDIIIELMAGIAEERFTPEEIRKDWDMLPQLDAHKNNRIFILKQPYIGIPGTRVAQTLMDMARIIHPEVKWE